MSSNVLCTTKQQHTARQHCICAASKDAYKVVVLGGGSGGSAVAAHYCRKLGKGQVAVVDPAGGCYGTRLCTLPATYTQLFESPQSDAAAPQQAKTYYMPRWLAVVHTRRCALILHLETKTASSTADHTYPLLTQLFLANHYACHAAESHYYQPMFTLVGGGLRSLQDATQPEADVLPQGVDWLRTAAAEIDADSSSITTADGKKLQYEYLIVATGEQNFV
jgi:hypothetical protein